MKRLGQLLSLLCLATMCACGTGKVKITVTNPSGFDRTEEMVEIPMDALADIDLDLNHVYLVKHDGLGGKVLPSQVTSDGKLIFQSGLKANESANFTISGGLPVEYDYKTFGRFFPERLDDYAWENDRVAFRIYGAALLPVDGPSNGMDAWYKRTSDLILEKWYAKDLSGEASYHNDNGEGLDDYKVGRTLGAGAMAPFESDTLWLNENFIEQATLDNGPLRTTFRLTYKDVNIDGNSYPETRTISLDAGSQLTKIVQEYGLDKPVQVAAGFPLRENEPVVESNINENFFMNVEPATPKANGVYFGMVMPGGIDKIVKIHAVDILPDGKKRVDNKSHVLAVTTYTPGEPVTYYTGYGWSKFGFETEADFMEYLKNFNEALKNPLEVEYK